jgi:hypothetical protein
VSPAEHYAEAELAIEAAVECMTPPNVSLAEANSLIALAAVHATLAGVVPDVLWPQKSIIACTCPCLGANALARTSTDPNCPIHGQGKD